MRKASVLRASPALAHLPRQCLAAQSCVEHPLDVRVKARSHISSAPRPDRFGCRPNVFLESKMTGTWGRRDAADGRMPQLGGDRAVGVGASEPCRPWTAAECPPLLSAPIRADAGKSTGRACRARLAAAAMEPMLLRDSHFSSGGRGPCAYVLAPPFSPQQPISVRPHKRSPAACALDSAKGPTPCVGPCRIRPAAALRRCTCEHALASVAPHDCGARGIFRLSRSA